MYNQYEEEVRMYDYTKGPGSSDLVRNWIVFFILKYSRTLELSNY